jgi:hypothetical protein
MALELKPGMEATLSTLASFIRGESMEEGNLNGMMEATTRVILKMDSLKVLESTTLQIWRRLIKASSEDRTWREEE